MMTIRLTSLLTALALPLCAQEPPTPAEEPAAPQVPAPAEVPAEQTPEATATAEEPAPADPAQEALVACELLITDGLAKLDAITNEIYRACANAGSSQTADEAAAHITASLDELRKWGQEFHAALQEPNAKQMYAQLYQEKAERRCMQMTDLSLRLANLRFADSASLRKALFRVSQEVPQTFKLRHNVQWACSGLLPVYMLEAELGNISDQASAKKAVANLQEITAALQPWREASKHQGDGKPKSRFPESFPPTLRTEAQGLNVKEMLLNANINIRTQAKRISYAKYYYVDGLAGLVNLAAESIADISALPKAEQHICTGIVLLGTLKDIMASVKNYETAHAAVDPINLLKADLQHWGEGFATLPDPDPDTLSYYNKFYLPRIDELNIYIRSYGELVSGAKYYDCPELFEALKNLIHKFQ